MDTHEQAATRLALSSPIVADARRKVGADAAISTTARDLLPPKGRRVYVTIDTPDGFALHVSLDVDPYDAPDTVTPTDPHAPYTLQLPRSIQGVSGGLFAIDELARLRGERRQALDTTATSNTEFTPSNRVYSPETGRRGRVTLTDITKRAVVVRWDNTGQLTYVAPRYLTQA
ncbi:hypothetical protein [Salinispora arenicola]|uniref:hypothetical protein n=1 Tax=Salinispora arenicola TaxID=168697 RepID=UPI000360BC13|nr:hypothetical protein [Salinispora arenicola]